MPGTWIRGKERNLIKGVAWSKSYDNKESFVTKKIVLLWKKLTWSTDLSKDCSEWTAACKFLARVVTVLFRFLYLWIKKELGKCIYVEVSEGKVGRRCLFYTRQLLFNHKLEVNRWLRVVFLKINDYVYHQINFDNRKTMKPMKLMAVKANICFGQSTRGNETTAIRKNCSQLLTCRIEE